MDCRSHLAWLFLSSCFSRGAEYPQHSCRYLEFPYAVHGYTHNATPLSRRRASFTSTMNEILKPSKLLPKARQCCLYFQNNRAFLSITLVQWTLPWLWKSQLFPSTIVILCWVLALLGMFMISLFSLYALDLLLVYLKFFPWHRLASCCLLMYRLGGLALPSYSYSCRCLLPFARACKFVLTTQSHSTGPLYSFCMCHMVQLTL